MSAALPTPQRIAAIRALLDDEFCTAVALCDVVAELLDAIESATAPSPLPLADTAALVGGMPRSGKAPIAVVMMADPDAVFTWPTATEGVSDGLAD